MRNILCIVMPFEFAFIYLKFLGKKKLPPFL